MPYGFIRNTDAWGVNSIPFQQYQQAGIDNLLFAANDPNLTAALAAADRAHIQSGVWLPASSDEGDPRAYAQRVHSLHQRYGNRTYVPNIEWAGKGYQGSKGWNWNEAMMAELTRLGIPPRMAVAMLPHQDDFNYKAYSSRGVRIMPEAFGASTAHDQFDPEQIRQTVIRNGVPANMIDVLTAPGQRGPSNALFPLEDFSPNQLHEYGQRRSSPQVQAPKPGQPIRPTAALDSILAAVKEGVNNPRRYMMQAQANPRVRQGINNVLRRQVANLPHRPR